MRSASYRFIAPVLAAFVACAPAAANPVGGLAAAEWGLSAAKLNALSPGLNALGKGALLSLDFGLGGVSLTGVGASSVFSPLFPVAKELATTLAPHDVCESAITKAAAAHGAPEKLMRAVALVESGRGAGEARAAWPWTINLNGAGHWFETRAQALAFARQALKRGQRSFDVGCMQLNYRWHGHAFESLEHMFTPKANASYAAKFLIRLHAETGDWMRAAGYYHSRTPSLSARYRAKIAKAHASLPPEPLAQTHAVAPSKAKPLLALGALALIAQRRGPGLLRAAKPLLQTGHKK